MPAERQARDGQLDGRRPGRSPRTRSRGRRRSGRGAPRSSPPGRRRRGARPSRRPRGRRRAWPRPGRSPRSAPAPASAAPITHDSPTPPSPMTATLAPGRDLRGLEHGPDAGRHAAADERGDGRVHAVGERDGGRAREPRSPRPSCRCRSRPGPGRRPRRRGDRRRPGSRWRNDGESGQAHGRPARQARHRPARDEPRQRDGLADAAPCARRRRPPPRRPRPRGP